MQRIQFCSLAVCLSLFSFGAIASEYRGTAEQRAACTPDAFRLCGDAIPDPKKVQYCLQRKLSQLSAGCRVAFGPPTD
jgi:hypothetical protein